MTAKQSNLTNWITIGLTVVGALGTGVWWAAALSAKVDGMQGDIAYIKGRIDGDPMPPKLPLTERNLDPIQSIIPRPRQGSQAPAAATCTVRR